MRAQFQKLQGLRPWNRHSLVLAVAGLTYITIGITYVRSDETVAAIVYASKWLPMNVWGWIWIVVGVVAMIAARWPPHSHRWGYSTLTGLTAAWSLFYVVGILFGEAPHYQIRGALGWGLMAFAWWGISGLVDVSTVPRKEVCPCSMSKVDGSASERPLDTA